MVVSVLSKDCLPAEGNSAQPTMVSSGAIRNRILIITIVLTFEEFDLKLKQTWL